MKKNLIFYLFIVTISNIYPQPLPLKLGNSWTYKNMENGSRFRFAIVDSGIIINNKSYFKTDGGGCFRFDKTDSIYYYLSIPDSQDVPYYKVNINYSDTVHFTYSNLPAYFYLVLESPGQVFDSLVNIKWISYVRFGGLTIEDALWAEEFGELSSRDAVTGNVWDILIGCVIDGHVYGDTTTVDVDDYFTGIPTEFKLYQNYPNPFNPRTVIEFDIPNVGAGLAQTTLKIYDVLSNEVTTLVNEMKEPGRYKVEFDAGNLSSGVYIYKLTAGSFVSSKKMMVIK